MASSDSTMRYSPTCIKHGNERPNTHDSIPTCVSCRLTCSLPDWRNGRCESFSPRQVSASPGDQGRQILDRVDDPVGVFTHYRVIPPTAAPGATANQNRPQPGGAGGEDVVVAVVAHIHDLVRVSGSHGEDLVEESRVGLGHAPLSGC